MLRKLRFILILAGTILVAGGVFALELPEEGGLPPIVFVARSHLSTPDPIFDYELGPAGQFGSGLTKFAPESLLVRRDPDGSLFVYDTPGLVDVQSPDVNFFGTKIVFAGATTLNIEAEDYGWRLYEINVDGSGFRQLTFSDRNFEIPNADQFGNQETYGHYDDFFPAYLADGRIVFSSSRSPSRAHYDQRTTFNLYVINSDGSNLHRITTDRGGFLHPTPLPDGRILATRWWNQFNQPSEEGVYNRIDSTDETHVLPDGTIILPNIDAKFAPPLGYLATGYPIREAPNSWHLMVLNPDGSEVSRLAFTPRYDWTLTDDTGHFDTYAATQPAILWDGSDMFIAYTSQVDNSMVHTTLETGLRVARPGVEQMAVNLTAEIAGLTYDQVLYQGDTSGPYALHPWGLPDGRILYSLSREDNSLPDSGTYLDDGIEFELQGSNLQYELHAINHDGSQDVLVDVNLAAINRPDADILDAKPIVARQGWDILPDTYTAIAEDDPHLFNLPYTMPEYWFSLNGPDDIQTATIHNPNIYANPPLDLPFINNSPPPGSVSFAEVWVDANQFTGAYCYNDYPQPCDDFRADNRVRAVLWDTVPVTLGGAFTATVPADTMSFIVLRDANGRIVRGWDRGYMTIAQGSAYARPGEEVTCIGCHMGHVSGSIDAVEEQAEAGWTNISPYASADASTFRYYFDPENPTYEPFVPERVLDRRGWVDWPAGSNQPGPFQDESSGWLSEPGLAVGEWVELSWPVPFLVSSVRLVGPPPTEGDGGGFGLPVEEGPYYVESGELLFYLGNNNVQTVNVGRVEPLSTGGTTITLGAPVEINRLRFKITGTTGQWYWKEIAALNEIEVIGRAAGPYPPVTTWQLLLPGVTSQE